MSLNEHRSDQRNAQEQRAGRGADRLLVDLDADQRHAVTTESRLVAVIAGAGSGKTRVLTRRVAYRIVTGSADAAHTLVLTFTREAAGELRRRLPRLGLDEPVLAGTFHSVAQRLLRQRWADTDRAPRSILSDRRRLVTDITGGEDVDGIVAEVDFALARGLDAADYTNAVRLGDRRSPVPAERVADTLERYEQEKRRRGVIDLDDLLALLIRELRSDAEFAETINWRFRHILVDEAQDLNPLQHRLVDLFRRGTDDLFLVGDPAQAIYAFNGSDPGLLTDVEQRFPGVEVVRLPTNHRSTPQIVGAGAHCLKSAGLDDHIRSGRPDGLAVTLIDHQNESDEARSVASAIAQLDPGSVERGQVAVLARTHATLEATRRSLAAAGLTVRRRIDGAGSTIAPLLDEAYRLKDPGRLRSWIRDQHELAAEDPTRAEVVEAAGEFLRDQPTGDGSAFRAWVTANDPFGARTPGVELVTFHAAKGREWPVVHLIGCETSLVPHRSATTHEARSEEARLLYVALTRATDSATVHWARRRGGYQRRLSPFLDGFASSTPPVIGRPATIAVPARSPRARTLDRLRTWRAEHARSSGILPDAVCPDRVLAIIAERRPASADELDDVTGLGALTARRLYPGIAAALEVDQEAGQARSTITGA
ncbi:MAG: ATP-dependent helicase [Ilumatobacteraceae bacterium]